uniref:Uncharacterized protein n=1 Tax=Timema shepardi TaxID=629360 RepID=A0A7R9G6P0_TIMSH|nr:unnamed protein product [Timema shepardi]
MEEITVPHTVFCHLGNPGWVPTSSECISGLLFENSHHIEECIKRNGFSVRLCVSDMVGSALQPKDGVPRSVTCRLVYLVSCLGGILLLTFYSAKIISVMTAKYNKLPFTSLKGLIEDGSYKLTISRNSNEYFMFANAKSGIYKEMYDTVMSHNPDDMPATTYEGSKMICQDDKTVIIFSNLFSYTTSIPCVFAVVPEVIYQFSQHYLFQKGSPFTGIVSRKLLKLAESGVIKKIIRDNKADNSFETETNDIAVGLTNVAPIFGILGAGLVMAVLLLGVELLVHHLQGEVSENMH